MEGPGADIAQANWHHELETEAERFESFRWHLNKIAETYPLLAPFVLKALAAPDLALALLAVEWSASSQNAQAQCPSCRGDEFKDGEPRTGHAEGCGLNATLRKAGVR